MKNFQIFFVLLILFFVTSEVLAQKEGTVVLCNEEQTIALEQEGVQIVGYSLETDSSNPGMHVQYRRVLRSEKVVTAQNGERPWYYLVYLGPVIPNTNSYVFWPAGDPPPWKKSISTPATGPVTFIGIHEHYGCDDKQPFCKKYANHSVKFNSLVTDKVTGTSGTMGTTFEGTFHGTVFQFTYVVSNGTKGKGTFNFSPNFKSFTGTFEDEAGHRGIWSGEQY